LLIAIALLVLNELVLNESFPEFEVPAPVEIAEPSSALFSVLVEVFVDVFVDVLVEVCVELSVSVLLTCTAFEFSFACGLLAPADWVDVAVAV
jgi:hypothetical protein